MKYVARWARSCAHRTYDMVTVPALDAFKAKDADLDGRAQLSCEYDRGPALSAGLADRREFTARLPIIDI